MKKQRAGFWLLGLLIVIAFASGFLKTIRHQPSTGFRTDFHPVTFPQKPRFQSDFASSQLHTQTHAASLVELNDGKLRAFWFSGSREGAKDVQIHSAVFDPGTNRWSAEQVVATRQDTEKSVLRYVGKLGNPVCARAPDGKLWLFYVTVSLGGWSGSSITMKTSSDEGKTWSAARRLVTSPFLNVSTLLKGTPFFYGDGTVGLPVYHEFIGKFSEILHFDQNGNVIDLQRLSAGQDRGLQPVVLAKSTFDALVLMRNASRKNMRHVIAVSTKNGGRTWSEPGDISLLNPNSALSAIVLPDQRILAVVNNQVRQGISKGRDALALMISADDGNSWKMVYRLENQTAARGNPLNPTSYFKVVEKLATKTANGMTSSDAEAHAESARNAMCAGNECGFEFSYPYLIQTRNGDFHLVYTWNRGFIKHVGFNLAWINQQLKHNDSVH